MKLNTHYWIKITENKLCLGNLTIRKDFGCYDYQIFDNKLVIKEDLGYEVASVNKDTLVLINRLVNHLTDDKVNVYTYVKTSSKTNYYKQLNQNESVLIANKDYFPKFNLTFSEGFVSYNEKSKVDCTTFDIEGKIVINVSKKTALLEIENLEEIKEFKTYYQKEIKRVSDLQKYWDLKGFENFQFIKLPVVIKIECDNISKIITYLFFETGDLFSDKKKNEITRLSNEFFKKGIIAYNQKDFNSAIELFKKAFNKNPKNVDAIYNLAGIYMELNDAENACKMLKILVNLGQNPGIKLYNENCVNEANKD